MKIAFPLLFSALIALSAPGYAQLQRIMTIAGTGTGGFNGDGIPGPSAELNAPDGLAVDASGNVYVQDFLNLRVRKITSAGYIYTIAGNGLPGSTGDGTIGTSARLSPYGVAIDKSGNIFISDAGYGVIRKVNATTGFISTIAGTGVQGYSGDNGTATAAQLDGVCGMTFDTSGNLYVADAHQNVVRMISPAGTITTVAGNNTAGFAGDNGPATSAMLDSPYSVATDRRGNLYISDMGNNVIRRVSSSGVITTIAGISGTYSYVDDLPAVSGTFNHCAGITTDTIGNLYIADAANNVIRKIDTFFNISTVIGNGTPGFGGDLGTVNGANLHNPTGVAIDRWGSLYIADANNQRIRKTYTPVGVTDVNLYTKISVSPNPFTNQVMVSGVSKGNRICIYDVAGRQTGAVLEVTKDGSQLVTINDLATGSYILQVSDNNGNTKANIKIVKE